MSCIICGECINDKYSISLSCQCKSQYHYECIFNTLKNDKYQKIYEDCLKCMLKYKKPTFRSVMFEDSCSGKNRY